MFFYPILLLGGEPFTSVETGIAIDNQTPSVVRGDRIADMTYDLLPTVSLSCHSGFTSHTVLFYCETRKYRPVRVYGFIITSLVTL